MLIEIPEVLTKDQVRSFRQKLDATEWIDGKVTAGHLSAQVKNNSQLSEANPVAAELGRQIVAALNSSPVFVSAALPKTIFPPLFNRYAGGQSFRNHVDNAVRRNNATGEYVRTDLSVTLFLSEPDEYDGGELVIEDTYGTRAIKFAVGSAVLYPSTSLHHVRPVTRGARVSSFLWLQSMVRRDDQRAILLNLDVAIQRLIADHPQHASSVELTGVYHNLLRQWVEL